MRVGPRGGGGIIGLLIVLAVVLINDLRDRDGGSAPAGGSVIPGAPGERVRVDVLRVVDGDTIEVEIEDRTEDVRYIGIDTPETVKPGTPVECYGKEASAANKGLVDGERVLLEFDRELRDRFGRLLAYVFVDDTFVNGELVADGYATTLEIEPNTTRASELARLEQQAGARGLGLWSSC